MSTPEPTHATPHAAPDAALHPSTAPEDPAAVAALLRAQPPPAPAGGMGWLALLGLMMGGGCWLFALLGAINTGVGGGWKVRIKGTLVELPDDWEIVSALGIVGALFIALTLFGRLVSARFRRAEGRRGQRVVIVAGALALLGAVSFALHRVAVLSTYGSMLAYYATDGALDDVKAELAKGPAREALDRAVSRAAQYDNHEALALLLGAGADLRQETSPEAHRRCVLGARVGPEFVAVAVEHGVTPGTCPKSDDLVWRVVQGGRSDAEVARVVELLLEAGWSGAEKPEHSQETAAELARRRNFSTTAATLGG